MTAKYFAILTSQGAARLANATALGTKLNLTQMAVGDANGALPTPDPAQTKLINQKRIAPLNLLTIDPANTSQIIAEQIIPESEGGFWIREIGLYDDAGVLIAVANCPETYKPQLQEGSGRTQTIRMILIVSGSSAITLKIDPSVVLATRQYVDDKLIEVKSYADNLMKQHVADKDPHKQYAPVASPTFTGEPKAPTAEQDANDKRLANTEFVQAAIAALVSGALAKKQPLDKTLTELSGKNVAALLEYLGLGGLGAGSALPVGVPVPWPTATPPTGWLKCNGATFSATTYPQLAVLFPALVLPDLRGSFIRGWDDGGGVDTGRTLLSLQLDALQNILGTFAVANGGVGTTTGAFAADLNQYPHLTSATSGGDNGISFNASRVVRTATETRPRNVAFNYIVRAA